MGFPVLQSANPSLRDITVALAMVGSSQVHAGPNGSDDLAFDEVVAETIFNIKELG